MAIAVFIVLVVLLIAAIRVAARKPGVADGAQPVVAVDPAGLTIDVPSDDESVIPWGSVRRVAVVTRRAAWSRRTRFGFHITIDHSVSPAAPGPFLQVTGDRQTEGLLRESHRLPGFDHEVVHNALRLAQRGPTTCFER